MTGPKIYIFILSLKCGKKHWLMGALEINLFMLNFSWNRWKG